MAQSDNEMAVLRAIISDPRAPNMAIAKELGLSSAGVGKIRDKLERKGYITGYGVDVDFESLGLKTFAILHIHITTDGWKYNGGRGVQEFIVANPNVIAVYRVPGRRITHIVLCVFRNLIEIDKFLHVIQAQLSDYIDVVESFIFSSESIIKDSCKDLLIEMIDEGEEKRMPEPALFGHILGEE